MAWFMRLRPYVGWGRRQFRVGVRVVRPDRWSDEFHFVAIEWQL
jgi:hypothetical protein